MRNAKLTTEPTNLERLQKYFPKADFNIQDDSYTVNSTFLIEWVADETFLVIQHFTDSSTGASFNEETFEGSFDECLKFVCKQEGVDHE